MKWFAGVTNVEELRKRYRELLKKYHPDNENGSVGVGTMGNTNAITKPKYPLKISA